MIIIFVLTISSCTQKPDAQKIINKSIVFYGMDKLDQKTISFDFREKHFEVQFNGGNYLYESTFSTDSLGPIKDRLSNKGFVREIKGLITKQPEKDSLKHAESINSVFYFAFLPLKLNDQAVKKKLLKAVDIKGKTYQLVEVSFAIENGGSHYDDVFYYWFDSDDASLDYLAYSAGGNRFRAVQNTTNSTGLTLQNYINYKAKDGEQTLLINYPQLFEKNELEKLSEIVLENLAVK
jgi:hypothetical protein